MSGRVLALLCIAVLLAGCGRGQDDAAHMPVDDMPPASSVAVDDASSGPAADAPPLVPSLRVETVDGAVWDIADHRGQWVVVNFWATWCPPCLKEMPELSALAAMRGHIEVIGLAWEEIEPEAMLQFLQAHPVVYPVAIVDVVEPPADFGTPRGIPMTYLIAPDGRIAEQYLGPVTGRQIEAAITEAGGPALPED